MPCREVKVATVQQAGCWHSTGEYSKQNFIKIKSPLPNTYFFLRWGRPARDSTYHVMSDLFEQLHGLVAIHLKEASLANGSAINWRIRAFTPGLQLRIDAV
mmetsp:Transcript_121546/g.236494  ORF Transcript_121546/g.236494 Transcript_121546/m.236494 type:complete len:101 (-) Transcript_121546:351-653(-)